MTAVTAPEPAEQAKEGEGSLRSSAMRGGIYLVVRQGLNVFLKLIGVMLITRVLGPTEYGAYVAAFNVYLYSTLIGQAGVGVYLLRHPGEVPDLAVRTCYALLALLGIGLMLGLEASRGLLTGWTGVPGYGPVMAVMALALPFKLITIPPTIALERALNYKRVATIEIGGDTAYYFVAVPLALTGTGAMSLAVSLVLRELLFFVLAHYYVGHGPRFGFDGRTAKSVIRYAGTFSFANWVWQARMLVNPLIVGPVAGQHAVGIVGMTVGILEMLSIIKTIAWRLSVSVLGRVQSDFEKIRRAVTEGMELQIIAVGSLLLGFAWFGGIAVPLVFGARWAPVMQLYPYVALAYLAIAAFNIHSAVMSVIDRNTDLGLCYVVHILLLGLGTWLGVRHFGMIGYGFGEMLALLAYGLVHWALARRIGSPDYRLAGLWFVAAALGLFWRQLGWWTIPLPFLALATPASVRRIRRILEQIRKPRRAEARA
ncbi:oligosaccharide flippase family protein [Sphingomonas morindae]|uniref:Oligosaccharide flippase family protein n=1 Tax=Sphingomonas morindae TaxID=1541170 RepID=A0ABY4X6G5_9SPHN|nr:oligosaccharide flippase family protein [Sphingomonas morindae]USI72467.1 oligosaccharide flippase family protein [Sphingomonas morindae]